MKKKINVVLSSMALILCVIALSARFYQMGFRDGSKTALKPEVSVANLYPLCGVVTEVDHKADTVKVTDGAGLDWVFNGAEDWFEGDFAALLMDDNRTPEVFDDKILDVKFCGSAI